jgi:hypothetical protein
MRYPASEKLGIIRIVEQSHLPAKRTLDQPVRGSVPVARKRSGANQAAPRLSRMQQYYED